MPGKPSVPHAAYVLLTVVLILSTKLFGMGTRQHSCITAFFGTQRECGQDQIWIAVSVYVLVAIVRKRLGLEVSL
jgi:hypothetical protein